MGNQPTTWNSALYQSGHSYVWHYGRDLLGLLEPKRGERILDVGCGTGQLTAEIAASGVAVLGVDSSREMIESARKNHPEVRFEVADATVLPFRQEFDAVFSNAALHWIRDQQSAIVSIARALKPGGRYVFEMGGHRNLRTVLEAGYGALHSMGVADPHRLMPWCFPSIGEYAPLLETGGFEVRFATTFDRPTVLDGGAHGLARWIAMFGAFALSAVRPESRDELIQRWEDLARPKLFRDGTWTLDYRRLRVLAFRI
jgi:trans-aconitate 2-methyltransferase